jgi:hypothetical protein
MFANTMMGGMSMGMPDVCKTPPLAIPIPYPNIAVGATAIPPTACMKVLMGGTPTHNLGTTIPLSNGDNAGVMGGVASQMVMGPMKYLMGSFSCLVGGQPTARITSMTGHNGMSLNGPGMSMMPSQFKVLVVAP